MKEKLSLLVIALILILPITLYTVFKAPTGKSALVAANGKPMVLEFSTPMCSECIKLKKVLDTVEPKYDKKISFLKVNEVSVGEEDFLNKVQKYNVKVVPTTIFLDKKGHVLVKKEGAMSESTLTSYLDELLK